MKTQMVIGIVLLASALGCDSGQDKEAPPKTADTSAPKPPQELETHTKPPPSESNPINKDDSAGAPIPGSLRLVVIHPDPPIVRKRKKRVDSKQEIKQRARRLEQQSKRLAALEAELGDGYTVTAADATEAEREFAAELVLGTSSEVALPDTWNRSQAVLVIQLAPGTDATERGGSGFVRTGSSKLALFHPPDNQPSYLEIAPKGLLIDTAEVLSIVTETAR